MDAHLKHRNKTVLMSMFCYEYFLVTSFDQRFEWILYWGGGMDSFFFKLFEPVHEISKNVIRGTSKASDQTARSLC